MFLTNRLLHFIYKKGSDLEICAVRQLHFYLSVCSLLVLPSNKVFFKIILLLIDGGELAKNMIEKFQKVVSLSDDYY